MHDFLGMQVVEAKEFPKYILPNEVIPGVPWPPGFKEEIDKWSREFLGMTTLCPKGTAIIMHTEFGLRIIAPKSVIAMLNYIA